MARLDDWQTLLAEELSKPRSFSWGKNDCCLFAGDIVQTITGIDPAATFRGKYDTALGAIKEIKRQGYEGVIDIANKTLGAHGWEQVPIMMAQRGDVLCADIEDQKSIGVMTDSCAVFVGKNGYVYLEREFLLKAWGVR